MPFNNGLIMTRLNTTRRLRLPGTMTVEALVALTLLTTVISVSTPLIVRHGRLLVAQRDYRLALDELSNQLERLTALPPEKLPAALENLRPSPAMAERLHGARLRGQLDAGDGGQRLTLEITWDEPQRTAAPVSLAAWIFPKPQPAGGRPREDN
jgi:hypothetical protein